MHDAHEVADMNHIHDLPHHCRRLTLWVVSFGNDAVEEFASAAELHD